MKTTQGLLNIEAIANCPYCGECIDLANWIDPDVMLNKVLKENMAGKIYKFKPHAIVYCHSCEGNFELESL